jgi:predicted ATPase
MKLLLTGSIGVGKTTLFERIPTVKGVYKIPEVARRVLQEAPELRLNPYFQRVLLMEQHFLETEAEKRGSDLIICDRGYIDVIAYAKLFKLEPPQDLIKAFSRYDMIFYCDPEGTPPLPEKIAGVTPNPHEKEELDHCLRATLSEMRLPWCVLKGPTEDRLSDFYCEVDRLLIEGQVYREGGFSRGAYELISQYGRKECK